MNEMINPIPLFIFCAVIWFLYGVYHLGFKSGERSGRMDYELIDAIESIEGE
jgi:hypothetical protein